MKLTPAIILMTFGLASLSLGEGAISSPSDLKTLLRETQEQFVPISPPSADTYWHQSDDLIFVDWSGFSKKVTKLAYGHLEETPYGLVPKYDLFLWEDAATREVVIENEFRQELIRLSPDQGYDALGWAKAYFDISPATALSALQQTIYDSAHTALAVTLTPVEFMDAYPEEVAVISMSMQAATMSGPPVPGPAGTNTAGSGTGMTNQPASLTFPLPDGFSGFGEILATDNIMYPSWSMAADRVSVTNETEFEWTDSTSSNAMTRYYILSDMEIDDDEDGYSNDRERLINNTDPSGFNHVDSDNDGLHDWYEHKLFGSLDEDADGDFDQDGLLNGEEMILTSTEVQFISNPAEQDTDSDGAGDWTEVAQGSNPFDDSDNGEPPTPPPSQTVAVTLCMTNFNSDCLSTYQVEVIGYGVNETLNCPHGLPLAVSLSLKKGTSYSIIIKHSGYQSYEGYVAAVAGTAIVIDNSGGALGDHSGESHDGSSWSGIVHVPKIETETVATEPAKRDRKTIGVGEEVKLTYFPANIGAVSWNISGSGSLDSLTGSPVKFTAGDIATNVIITATCNNHQTTVSLDVQSPSGVLFENYAMASSSVPDSTVDAFTLFYVANVYVQPDTVNFLNIELQESDAPSVKTGYYLNKSVPDHSANAGHIVTGFEMEKGSLMDSADVISMYAEGGPYSNGAWTCSITWSYSVNGGNQYPIEVVDQAAELAVSTNKVTFTVSKDESGVYIDTVDKEGKWIDHDNE